MHSRNPICHDCGLRGEGNVSVPHDHIAQLLEKNALERLGKIVRNHYTGGKIFNLNFFGFDPVGNEKVLDINVSSSLTTGGASVGF
jgi:hypothetical protein